MLYELKRLGVECWDMRKNMARQMGETASSKLMLPLMIMFLPSSRSHDACADGTEQYLLNGEQIMIKRLYKLEGDLLSISSSCLSHCMRCDSDNGF